MGWVIVATLFLSVLKAALCFNIDPMAWKTLNNSAAGFGYQVVQRQSELVVSAPLEQYSPNDRGEIFTCNINSESCTRVSPSVPNYAVNTSLGLTLKANPTTQETLACGPTIPKDCTSITMYNGLCFPITTSNRVQPSIPSSIEECRWTEVAFLLDGSGSVFPKDFQIMKNFVKNLVRSSLQGNTRFSISQFSTNHITHYYFNNVFSPQQWETNIDNINQLRGGTYTAEAIKHVVEKVFVPEKGSSPIMKKILIVITDGESQDRPSLPEAIRLANQKNIIRFTIGVGSAFRNSAAKEELDTIASSPSNNYVFQVDGFGALEKIRQNLQNKIFSIEGSQSSGESLKMEMSQEGFSAAFVPGGIQLAVVGANQWRGGYVKYSRTGSSGPLKGSYFEPAFLQPDSYLGYSMAVAKTTSGTVTIVGAPRYQHRGIVMVVDESMTHYKIIDPYPQQFQQSGEYFGAEVCAMSMSSQYTDLILISAPMHMESEREGRVYVCQLKYLTVECRFDSPLVLRGAESSKGRFGSSLAVLPDLNTDGISDLAVGAPLENDGQGSIYIFHGERRPSINPIYSQRITGSEVKSGLKYFGLSISQESLDQSGDKLPDLAVGSKGTVVLLRSRPIVMVEAIVSFDPKIIPTQNVDCSVALQNTATICFTMTSLTSVSTGSSATIKHTFTLDATRKAPKNRAYITDKQREATKTITVSLNRKECSTLKFFIQACAEDVVSPLSNELRFSFEGLSSSSGLKPSLAQQSQTTAIHSLGFEINCGTDNQCVDDLKLDFNFTRSSLVKVGIDELLDVTVSVENRGENSYSSRVTLTYPAGLSYRKFTGLQGRIECNSLDSEDVLKRGKTDCTIDKPIFKSNSKALFIISYGIGITSELDRKLFITANATSGNEVRSSSSDLYKMKEIDVKHSIFVTIESSLSYNNFSFGKSNLEKQVKQSIKVTNVNRVLNFTVVIRVPVKLGDKDIWVDLKSLQIANCQRGQDEQPAVRDFVAHIQKTKSLDCSVAWCTVFRCNKFMGRGESATYNISANVSSQWIEQIGLQSAKFLLTSTASLEYDTNQYIFFSARSNNNPPVQKVEAEIEVYPEPDFTKEIVGGSLGGLAFLALLTAGLYKAGFFKSKYNQMISESAEGEEDLGADEDAA
ncbi:integrin alpha-X-like isoform X3 [Mugil cephalus]|uniref:integrin alpha-X-like isoform X3 n=1 Tax=Mugil cephalus TaxID=48193 RepID=UPI001FB7652B|nr:integrin alpha-X-like isoform X3 [Mugil cephalus]